MKERSRLKSGNSLGIAVIFLLTIALLIVGGFLLKIFLLLRASTFDGSHQYILEVDSSNNTGELVAFMPENKSLSILQIRGRKEKTYGNALGVPTDAQVHMDSSGSIDKQIGRMFFESKNEAGITIIDKIRLLLFVNSLKSQDIHEQAITMPLDESTAAKVLPSLFLDNTLYNENASIAIVNATGQSGIGNLIAKELSVVGMNVVSVTTANTVQEKTNLTAEDMNSYTLRRIEKLFHVSSQKGSQTIADMTLTIGKKSLSELQ